MADRQSSCVRRLLLLTSAIVFVDTLFFAALTPLLPHYASTLGLGKTGAGLLSAAYPAGALLGAIPSGVVAARAGVKRTVVVGLCAVAICTILFGIASAPWQLDARPLPAGRRERVLLDRRARLARRRGSTGPARQPDRHGVRSRGRRRALRPGARRHRLARRNRRGRSAPSVSRRSGSSLWAAVTPSARPEEPQSLRVLEHAFRDRRVLGAFWFVVLPALLFGTVSVLAPLRLSALGFGSVAIGAVFLASGALEAVNNIVVGSVSDRRGPLFPIAIGLGASIVVAAVYPLPGDRVRPRRL